MDKKRYLNLCKEIDESLSEIVSEFNEVRELIKNNQKFLRTRLLLCMSLLEVICNLYNDFNNLGLKNSELLPKWLKDYCLTERNPTYKNHNYIRLVDEQHIYKLRNAIIHTFGLSEPQEDIGIIVPNGIETGDVITRMHIEFKKHGTTIAFISADSFLRLFIDGYRLMSPEIFKNVDEATQTDLDGLERIAKEFDRRGAKKIPLI